MVNTKKIVASVATAATLLTSISPAFAGCGTYDRGSPHADSGDWTKLYESQHANNTWQDWFWRGSWEGKVFKCPWNNADPTCPINLDFTKSTSHSKEVGFSIGAGGGTNDWFKKAAGTLTGSFNYNRQTTWTDSFSFRPGGSIRRNQYAEPITVQDRRWRRGYYHGGWMQTSATANRYGIVTRCYDFDWNRNYGEWTSNTAENTSYHTLHIYY